MSQNTVCHCPQNQSAGQGSQQKGEVCPSCRGRRPSAVELIPSPAKRVAPQAELTDFPVLKLEQPGQLETSSKFERIGSKRVPPRTLPADNERLNSHEAEQKKITRLLAVAIAVWALFSLIPGGVAWRSWLGDLSANTLPLWVPLFGAFGVSPLCLGILLWQAPDWCTLKLVAIGLLAIACGYAFAATLFGLAGSSSGWLAWLDFPQSDAAAATIWCSCMSVLAATLSLICFFEGQRWQRVVQLFAELQKKK